MNVREIRLPITNPNPSRQSSTSFRTSIPTQILPHQYSSSTTTLTPNKIHSIPSIILSTLMTHFFNLFYPHRWSNNYTLILCILQCTIIALTTAIPIPGSLSLSIWSSYGMRAASRLLLNYSHRFIRGHRPIEDVHRVGSELIGWRGLYALCSARIVCPWIVDTSLVVLIVVYLHCPNNKWVRMAKEFVQGRKLV